VVAVYVAGFADGTGDHLRWMTHGGIHAYARSYPQVPIQVFFVALIVLDPLTMVLVGGVRRTGIWLAIAVMVLDIAANWFGNWSRITGAPANLLATGPWVITAFGVFVLATSFPLLRRLPSERDTAPFMAWSAHAVAAHSQSRAGRFWQRNADSSDD